MLVLWMRDWSATARVLNSQKDFLDFFRPEVSRVQPPRLPYLINKEGVIRAPSVVDVFQRGAKSVETIITSLTNQFTEFRREQQAHNNATTHQLAGLQPGHLATAEHLKQLSISLTNHSHALFALSHERETRSLLTSIQLQLQSERLSLRFLSDSEREEVTQSIDALKKQERELLAKISSAKSGLSAIVGGLAANALGAPPASSAQASPLPGLGRSPSQRLRSSRLPSPSPSASDPRNNSRFWLGRRKEIVVHNCFHTRSHNEYCYLWHSSMSFNYESCSERAAKLDVSSSQFSETTNYLPTIHFS
ncbi:hypothetical protein R3P38DRAFT_3277657 [Favolaschia claudopus]|uniref:Uncharacterized protein n=1 Tax=Favolaschia claudopus TaxID=2862362 RepID=A0AAW0ALU6_9AGAR